MKRIGLTIILAWVAWAAMAQVQIGPKVGLNLSTISDGKQPGEGEEESLLLGFNVGLATNIMISEHFSVAPELLFSQKGLKARYLESYEDAIGKFDYTSTLVAKISYLEVPVLARLTFGRGYINMGPSVGYWLGGSYKESGYDEREAYSEEGRIKFVDKYSENDSGEGEVLREDAKRLDLGAVFGGGIVMNTRAGDLLLDLRYQRGLTNLQKLEDTGYDRFKNNTVSASVIYLFLRK